MMWLADVLIGTQSHRWNKHDAVDGVSSRSSFGSRLFAAFRGVWTLIDAAYQRRVAIRELRRLNPHLLNDIGIERTQIEAYVRAGGLVDSRGSKPASEQINATGATGRHCSLVHSADSVVKRVTVQVEAGRNAGHDMDRAA